MPDININGIREDDKIVDGFIISSKSQEQGYIICRLIFFKPKINRLFVIEKMC